MTTWRITKATVVGLACFNWLLPIHQLCAADPLTKQETAASASSPASPVRDVVLGPGGRLIGQALDRQGHPQKHQAVLLLQHSASPQRTTTDADGNFAFVVLRPGLYQIATDTSVITCRCWANGTAPPVAQERLLLVEDSTIERGQHPIGEALTNPLLLGLIIGAAIAIPIAVHNSKKSAS